MGQVRPVSHVTCNFAPVTCNVQLLMPIMQVFGGSKISVYVQFPLEGLNISEFLADPPANHVEHVYDAIGTIEHRGMLYGGHYISYTKHPCDGQW